MLIISFRQDLNILLQSISKKLRGKVIIINSCATIHSMHVRTTELGNAIPDAAAGNRRGTLARGAVDR